MKKIIKKENRCELDIIEQYDVMIYKSIYNSYKSFAEYVIDRITKWNYVIYNNNAGWLENFIPKKHTYNELTK